MDIEKFDRKMSDALIRKLTRKQARNFIRTGKDFNKEITRSLLLLQVGDEL